MTFYTDSDESEVKSESDEELEIKVTFDMLERKYLYHEEQDESGVSNFFMLIECWYRILMMRPNKNPMKVKFACNKIWL